MLLGDLSADFKLVYLVTDSGGVPGEDEIPLGEGHSVRSFASVTQPSRRRSAAAFVSTLATTLRLLARQRVDLVVTLGNSHAVPMFLAARLLGKRTVFIESITRVDRLSDTGRIIYHSRLADHFLIQWPALQKHYKASQLGTIL